MQVQPNGFVTYSDRFIPTRTSKTKDYFGIPPAKINADDPLNKRLRNALFEENLQGSNKKLRFQLDSDFQGESFQTIWKNSLVVNQEATKVEAKIQGRLLESHKVYFSDNYYSNCIALRNEFLAICHSTNYVDIFKSRKVIAQFELEESQLIPGESITSVEISDAGNLFFGSDFGSCYIQNIGKSYIEELPYDRFVKSTYGAITCLAFSNDSLSITDNAGNLVSYSVKEGVIQHSLELSSGDYACRILPPFRNGNYKVFGHNGNQVTVYDNRKMITPLHVNGMHTAGVRALAWNPHCENELASGGGYKDKKILIWDVSTNEIKSSLKTSAQIVNLMWNQWPRKQTLTCVNGYNLLPNMTIDVYETKRDRKLQLQTTLEIQSKFRPIHSVIDPSNYLYVGGGDFLQKWKLVDPSIKRTKYEDNLKEKWGIR